MVKEGCVVHAGEIDCTHSHVSFVAKFLIYCSLFRRIHLLELGTRLGLVNRLHRWVLGRHLDWVGLPRAIEKLHKYMTPVRALSITMKYVTASDKNMAVIMLRRCRLWLHE